MKLVMGNARHTKRNVSCLCVKGVKIESKHVRLSKISIYRDILKYRYRVSIFFHIELDIDIQGKCEKVHIFSLFNHFSAFQVNSQLSKFVVACSIINIVSEKNSMQNVVLL